MVPPKKNSGKSASAAVKTCTAIKVNTTKKSNQGMAGEQKKKDISKILLASHFLFGVGEVFILI